MILRSIEVEGFRCFDRTVTVSGFAPGLNVLHGPNGAGKSTLLRALQHALVDAHSLTGALVKQAMTPWGRALSPRIRVSFEHDGTEWRVEKRFLTGPAAKLERQESGVFRPKADGKKADEMVREMLQAEGAARGMASDVHLGLLQVLWTPQGAPLLPNWSAGVRTTLQQAFGAALSSKAADALAGLVETRYEEYFTPTGQTRKASPVTPLQQSEARLREELAGLREQWYTAGLSRETLVTLRARIAEKAGRLAASAPQLELARQRQSDLSAATAAELQARGVYESLDLRVRQWRADIAARQQTSVQEEAARAGHETIRRQLAAAEALQPEIARKEQELEALQQSGVDARAWPDLLRHRALTAECAGLAAQLEGLPSPSAQALAELRRLHQELQVKQAALEAASLRLTLEAEAGLQVETGGESRAVAAGERLEWTSPQSLSLRIPGVARLTAASANAQAAALAADAARLQNAITGRLGGETLAAWEDRFARRDQLQRAFDTRTAELRPLLPRAAEFAELARRRAEWETAPPEIDAIRVAWKRCKDSLEADRGQYQLPALSAADAAARTKLESIQAQGLQIGERLAQHAAAGSIDALEEQRRAAELDWTSARNRLQSLQAGGPADVVALEQSVQALRAALEADRESAARMEGELTALQSQNLYTRLAETEERHAECAAELERQRRRAGAIDLLRQSLLEAQRTISASLPSQIAAAATTNWRRIAGPDAHAIQIDETWTPAGLQVPDANAPLGELSGGEAEQVAFATRLALATQLAQHSRQLAVFDDAFLATDPARAGRILELLAEAAGRLQIIVLTCHPDRYAALDGVQQFDLEKLKEYRDG